MNNTKLLLTVVLATTLFISCNNDYVNEKSPNEISIENAEKKLPESAADLRKSISSNFSKILEYSEIQTRGESVDSIDATKEINETCKKTIKLLKDEGFSEKDWKDFDGENDPRLALAGAIYLGIIESSASNSTNEPYLGIPLTRGTSEEGGFDGSLNIYKVEQCLFEALGVNQLMKAFAGQCITKAIAWGLCKTFATKYAGPIGYIFALAQFAVCMDWIEVPTL